MMYLIVLRCTLAVFVLFPGVNFCLNHNSLDPTLRLDQWKHNVCVSKESGHDTKECLKSCDSRPCEHLYYVLENLEEQNQTAIYVERGHYVLSKSYMFWNVTGLALIGERSEIGGKVVIECEKNAGLAYIYSSDIILRNVILTSCGAPQNSTSFQYPRFVTALFLVNCINFTMNKVTIQNAIGIGIQLYDVAGVVNISNSHISNCGTKKTTQTKPGGGFYFEFTSSGGLYPFKTPPQRIYQEYGKFHFSNVWFLENTAPSIADTVSPNKEKQNAFGRGGGASFFFRGSAQNNTFVFENCHFNKNKAEWGAGLFVEFQQKTMSNSIIFRSCNFIANTARLGGGAVRIGLITMSQSFNSIPNWIRFTLSNFVQNKAKLGGSIALYATTKQSYRGFSDLGFANFSHCVIKDNFATIGSAFSAALWDTNEYEVGSNKPLKIYIANSTIENNKITTNAEDMISGTGALYSKCVPILLDNTTFFNNSNTALVLDNAIVGIFGDVSFFNNSGQRGGAMSLYGLSRIKVSNRSNLTFTRNTCQLQGGAIYVKTPGPQMVAFKSTELKIHRCFFDFEPGNSSVIFRGNKGPNDYSGNSVYATTLQFCRHTNESRVNNLVLERDYFHYYYANGTKSNMKFEIVTDAINMEVNSSDWSTTADKSFSPVVKLTDEKSNSVMGVIKISIMHSTNKARLIPSSTYFLAKDEIKSLRIIAKPKTHYDISLETVDSQLVSQKISNATITECAPGFVWDSSSCKCDDKQDGVSRCDNENQTLFLLKGYWGGYGESSGDFAIVPCPEHYCHCTQNNLTSDGECYFEKSKQCNGNRDGQLCGICKKGYTLYVGNDQCTKNCKSTSKKWIGYLIGLILFLTFLIVLFIMYINFDPFSSYLNAWLYFYQVLRMVVPGNIDFDPFLTFIDGLAHIQLTGFGGICMWSNMNDLEKLAFNYLLPFYFFICLFVLHKVVLAWPNNFFTRRVTQNSCARAFCTIFVLSYSTVVNISFKILYPIKIGDDYYLYYQGTMRYLCSHHIPFAVVAILLVVFVGIIFPLILIRREWFESIDNGLKRLLLDNFQRCFRNGYEWCAGFYFVGRFILLVLSDFVPKSPLQASLLNSVCCITLTVFVLCQPYVGEGGTIIPYRILNTSDAVLLCNLCLISGFGSAATGIHNYSQFFKYSISILSYVPLLFSLGLLGYVLRHRYLTYTNLLEVLD
ncbi:uncharacterized protein LOC114528211 [Dendronephthya gigantea]|uniref:uncharacterized protein LOC114528211 n=1 Tax=Dendronephthya gigantea TaxID=151771 RepID=UPI0010691F22|nr:uncharacterized protein LOC114528211 [Dendronephthya gigantea]